MADALPSLLPPRPLTPEIASGTEPNRCLLASFGFVSQAASCLVILLSVAGLVPALPWPFAEAAPALGLRPVTALAFGLAGVSALLWNRQNARWPWWFLAGATACAVTALGIWSTAAFIGGSEMGSLQASAAHPVNAAYQVRMALASSLGVVMLGVALMTVEVGSRGSTYLSQLLGVAAGMVSWFGVLDHALGPRASHLMSTGTTLALALMSLAVLNLRPDRGVMSVVAGDSLGGSMARRLLPAAVVLTLAVGWLRWEGERAGLYDTQVGVALSVSTQLMLLVLLIWSNARSLEKADHLRRSVEQVLYRELEQLRSERVGGSGQRQ